MTIDPKFGEFASECFAAEAARQRKNTPLVLRPKCRACSKHRHPREFVGGFSIGICWCCYQNHHEALNMLAGNPPRGCQDCYLTMAELDELSRRRGLADTRLVLERKDGILQILCLDCDRKYQRSRLDLYPATTPHGHQLRKTA